MFGDEADDELADYFRDGRQPKILITTSKKAISPITYGLIEELCEILPNTTSRPRKDYDLIDICKFARNRDFTTVMVVNEDAKKPNAVTFVHIGAEDHEGMTAMFKLTSVALRKDIRGHANMEGHRGKPPEVILNNFNTRLGHQVGRLLASVIPQSANFFGRRVVTFHNQRDFVFFRHHRYVFRNGEKAGLQEIGPRFTLKLKSLQKGTFDTHMGEYEWIHKPSTMDTSRRRFFL